MEVPEGKLPFTYLGAPIFKYVIKGIYFKKAVDRISSKLTSWKGMLLFIAGRLKLVKSVVRSMMLCTMLIYHWPKPLLHMIEGVPIKNCSKIFEM